MSQVKHRVLFVCIHNSARSQMAEAFLKQLGGDKFEASSAGIEAGKLNPNVVKVMAEIGIDISNNQTTQVFDLFRQGKTYDAVVTVCDAANAERCPVFPGRVKRIAWSFTDPSGLKGTEEEVLAHTRKVRDEIKEKIAEFVSEASELKYWMSGEPALTTKI
jgi:arsenate reductase (thioredoxin)